MQNQNVKFILLWEVSKTKKEKQKLKAIFDDINTFEENDVAKTLPQILEFSRLLNINISVDVFREWWARQLKFLPQLQQQLIIVYMFRKGTPVTPEQIAQIKKTFGANFVGKYLSKMDNRERFINDLCTDWVSEIAISKSSRKNKIIKVLGIVSAYLISKFQ